MTWIMETNCYYAQEIASSSPDIATRSYGACQRWYICEISRKIDNLTLLIEFYYNVGKFKKRSDKKYLRYVINSFNKNLS